MSAGKHTPGPWVVRGTSHGNGDYSLLVGVREGDVPMFGATLAHARTSSGARHFGGNGAEIEDEFRANACLMAAAPELLEVLEQAAGVIDAHLRGKVFDVPKVYGDLKLLRKQVRAAIAKARGGK